MDFANHVSSETSALVSRLLTNRTGAALHQLHAVREALEAAARALETPPAIEHDIHELTGRLAGAADAAAKRVEDEARRAIEALHADLRVQADENARLSAAAAKAEAESALLRSELQTAQDHAASAERDLIATVDAHAALERALAAAEAESRNAARARAELEGELASVRAHLDRAAGDATHLRGQLEQHAAGNADLERQLIEARQTREQRDALAGELQGAQAQVRALESSHGQKEDALRQLQARLDDALHTEERLRQDLARRQAQAAGEDADVETLRNELERMVSLFDASVRALNEMVNARTSNDLLGELVKRLSIQFSRVALFRVKGSGLEGEQQVGFDDADVAKLAVPLTVDSVLTRAVSSGTVQALSGPDLAPRLGLPFGGAPTSAVALPIVLQGTTLAVVYADDADMPDSARGPAVHESSVGFARLLVGEASVLLMCHTHELKTLAELRQYANTLLNEAREMHRADSEAGKPANLLRSRLKENLDCASQLYAYRAAMEGTAAAALLDEQITVEMSADTPFGRDLAFVVSQSRAADLAITAEAS